MMVMARAADVVVTGSRMAVQEDLGDLKLYRVPFATTVAANAQKQVAMIDKAGVPVSIVYAATASGGGAGTTMVTLRARNRVADGLGVPLPAGPVAAFEPGGRGLLLIGEGSVDDKAIGEEVEIEIAEATQVSLEVVQTDDDEKDQWSRYEATVSNANPWPVAYEMRIAVGGGQKISRTTTRLARDDGMPLWRVTVPANSSRTLGYRITNPKD